MNEFKENMENLDSVIELLDKTIDLAIEMETKEKVKILEKNLSKINLIKMYLLKIEELYSEIDLDKLNDLILMINLSNEFKKIYEDCRKLK
ncbi:hypothetical protein NST81_09360 [Bacillus sp. FSL W8-0223]|uniref:hypothetical protein n=1 Tax=Bacillus sp. FSL W8-0223 TaxID=2954595 RepID=UPI0030F917D8